ncbi:MAG: ABC transporter ATP-binding protein [Pseudomonadota bacterium]
MSTPNILTVGNLSLELDAGKEKTRLVKDVGFQIAKGKVLGLIGESGCGKSLTCLSIMGLLPPRVHQVGGEIFLEGRALGKLGPAEKRSLRGKTAAMILQNPLSCFDSVFSIRHHFRETLASHQAATPEEADRAAREALGEVGFEDPAAMLDLYPFQMSGGMLQRVMAALAVMMNVSLLIADEPTTDLDVVSQARILDLLAGFRDDRGMSMLLVTHDLSVVARLADEVVVMKDGAIVESGRVRDIFRAARHPYTKALLQAHSSLYGPELKKLLDRPVENPRTAAAAG